MVARIDVCGSVSGSLNLIGVKVKPSKEVNLVGCSDSYLGICLFSGKTPNWWGVLWISLVPFTAASTRGALGVLEAIDICEQRGLYGMRLMLESKARLQAEEQADPWLGEMSWGLVLE